MVGNVAAGSAEAVAKNLYLILRLEAEKETGADISF